MDSNVGLDCIVDNPDYCSKLASALDTACTSVKKQVVELLSALCVYSQDARQRAIDTLHIYQERKSKRYRLSLVVDELQKATEEDYQTALLAFINCLVISAPVLKDRVRIRNEFIGLKLLPILNELRKTKSHVPDLRVQLDVFDDQRDTDEVLYNQGPPGIDLSSHVDIFYAILGQVADTPQEVPFLSILQHLLRLDPKDPASDLAWDTAETLVHRATLLENREDATKLLRSPSLQTNLCCHCRGQDQSSGTGRKGSVQSTTSVPPPAPPIPPAPPAPPDSSGSYGLSQLQPPPPPPPLLFSNVNSPRVPTLESMMGPPPGPPLPAPVIARSPTPEPPSNNAKLLPQQEIPTPKAKMKTINWNKIPNHKVIGKHNIWSLVANDHQNSPMADLDWAEMEGLFCQQVPPIVPTSTVSSSYGQGIENERRRREPTEISLLDGKRSLNVNIFLKQFRSSNEDIIQLIRDGGHDNIGAEKLRGLLKILPEVDELEMLKSFDGDKSKLGNAEKFFLQLVQVSNYKLRIECMLLKEEFAANMSYLSPSINSMILAGDDLMANKPLQQVLYMVLVAGNFLNSGGYAGNAAGVKLSSLQKLTEIRANKPGMNLIHYVALQAERKRKDLLSFARNMSALDAATKTTVEQLTNEFNCLDSKIKKIKSHIQLPSTEIDIQDQMAQFLQMAEQEMAQLKRDMEELEGVRKSLAEFFCEDINTFKIEECFKIFHQFCQKFNQAVSENERRKIQEEQAMARRKQREEQLLAKKRLWSNQIEIPDSESEANLMDYGIFDSVLPKQYSRSDAKMKRLQSSGMTSDEDISIAGSPNIRRRLGSCSGGPDQLSAKEDTYSPDITPNGTLRRRRSRIPCEDDDGNLMDFLRNTGHDNARERKSWGSLDRSWAKRARGQPRRSDLLNVDFSGDRERPSSPSPLIENKPFLQEEESKPAGKAWRMKIEAWLSENEKEERAGEELQRKARQLQANRRSFEDSENESKNSLTNAVTEDNSIHEYPRSDVYNWRSSVEKADVLRTMEALEEVQPNLAPKDKSPWRKSSLNVPNSNDDGDLRYSRRRSRLTADNILGSTTLHAIREEERKKNKTSEPMGLDGQDELTIYIRQPYSSALQPQSGITDRRLSKLGATNDANKKTESPEPNVVSDKIDIDSDNIETPPATRRIFSPPKEVKPVEKEPCKRERCSSSVPGREAMARINNLYTDLGSGNFDRFSAARRTRRYKKLPETANADKDAISKIEDVFEDPPVARRPSTLSLSEDKSEDNDAMLRVWQNKLKKQQTDNNVTDIDVALAEITKTGEDLQLLSQFPNSGSGRSNPRLLPVTQPAPVIAVTNTVLSPVMQESRPRETPAIVQERAITSRERKRSMIDPSQVQEAYRLTSEPPSQVNNAQIESISRIPNKIQNQETESQRDSVGKQNLPEPTSFKSRFAPEITPSSDTSTPFATKTIGREDLHDEGFEETQSLVSETLSSQETSSGNFETDTHDSSTRCSPANLGTTNNSVVDSPKKITVNGASRSNKTSPIYEKTTNLRKSKPEIGTSYLPKRTPSLKRDSSTSKINVAQHPVAKRISPLNNASMVQQNRGRLIGEVERSGSRSSLRSSSRSSLNSASSVNTVRRIPGTDHPHLARYTSAIRALTNDLRKNSNASSVGSGALSLKDADKRRPTYMSRSGRGSTGSAGSGPIVRSRVPASRSSSSGSSVGPPISSLRKNSGVIDRTDLSRPSTTRPRSAVSSRSNSGGISNNQLTKRSSMEKIMQPPSTTKSRLMQPRSNTTRSQSFMRPTAASVNKGSISNIPKSIKTYVK